MAAGNNTSLNIQQPNISIFDGEQNEEWRMKMRTLFVSQDVWELVENGYEDPDDISTLTLAQQEKLRENKKEDAKALYFIQVAVSTSIFPRIIGANRSKEAWDTLKNEFQGSEKIIMGNGSIVKAKGKGTIAIQAKEATKYIRDVLLLPDLEQNLLSVGQLVEHGYMVHFEDNGCKIYDKRDGKKVMANVKMEKSRNFPISFHYPRYNALKVEVKNESWLWHKRYGHLNFQSLRSLQQKEMVYGLPKIESKKVIYDLIVTGSDEKMVHEFKSKMMKRYEMNDLGLLHYFLGIEIQQTEGGIFICQKKYGEAILKKFKMYGCKSVGTPLVVDQKLIREDGSGDVNASLFRSLVGSLLYLSATRPDIIDWPGSVDDMRSTSGYAFSLGSGMFSWASKKQQNVAQSSAEAEYVAAAVTTSQAIWLRRILGDMGEEQAEATTLMCDNKSAIAMTKNPRNHCRTKHINIKYHFVREAVENGEVQFQFCKTEDQVADVFTKAIPKERLDYFRLKLGVQQQSIKGQC
ncbi:hypothetical protein RJ640_012291 [Escallonia rubra]|uniref:Uncharacterized protein n=1 Tax=Escallonia rubra TaxID=112253 RepID=A0AA88U8Q3_9ASTE|nr:hypothetical protein RJ640_012291 [Escallonia rubra]